MKRNFCCQFGFGRAEIGTDVIEACVILKGSHASYRVDACRSPEGFDP
jgi:hypothetical protein